MGARRNRSRTWGGEPRRKNPVDPNRPPRYAPAELYPVQPPGVCRFCRAKVAPPRKSWCSERCVENYLALRCQSGLRKAVFDRDLGVCSAPDCKIDCTNLETVLKGWQKTHRLMWRAVRERLGLNSPFRKTTWDADHVVAVSEGGGSCPLNNVRTLCLWCHKRASSELADRKAGRVSPPRPSGKEVVTPILAAARDAIIRGE